MGVGVAGTLLALVGILCWDLPVYSVLGADGTGGEMWDRRWGGTGLGAWEAWIQLEQERKDRSFVG